MPESLNLIPLMLLVFLASSILMWVASYASTALWGKFQTRFVEQTSEKLQKLFVFTDAKNILYMYVGTVIIFPVFFYLLYDSIFIVVLLVIFLILVPRLVMHRMQKQRARTITEGLPDVLDQIAGSMVAGSTFIGAMQLMVDESEGPLKQEFSLALREIRLGTHLDDALDNLGERVRSDDMDLVVSAATIAREVGGNLAETLNRLASTLRRRNEMEKKVKALTAQGVLQGWVVCILPFAILVVLRFLEPLAVEALFGSVLGWSFLFVICTMEALGGFFISKIVAIDI